MNNKVINLDPTTQRESFSELLGDLAKNSAALVHNEIQLGIQKTREMVKAAISGALLVVTGAMIVFAGFICLCAALIIGLTSYMEPIIAALITGVGFAIVGVIISFTGYRLLKN
jgi:hypothetical protein